MNLETGSQKVKRPFSPLFYGGSPRFSGLTKVFYFEESYHGCKGPREVTQPGRVRPQNAYTRA